MGNGRPEILAVSIISFVLGSVFKTASHEHLMLFAWVLDLGLSFSLFYAIAKGLGSHEADVKPNNEEGINKALYAFDVLYNPVLMVTKSSILVFYLKLTHGRGLFHFANYATLFVVNVAGLGLTLSEVYQCHPVSAIFHFRTQTAENCTNIFQSSLSVVPYDIVTDMAIIILPIPLLTRMHLPWKQKVILVITFGVGILVIVVDVLRIAQLQNTILSRLEPQFSYNIANIAHQDYTYITAPSFMWSIVDVNMTIICACVPSLKPLANRFTPRLIWVTDKHAGPHSSPRPSDEDGATEDGTRQSAENETVGHELLEVLTGGQVEREVEEQVAHIDEGQGYSTTKSFVNRLNLQPPNMLKLSNKESVLPIVLITVIYFLWGFSYGLLNTINSRFRIRLKLDIWSAYGLHSAYWGGYLVGPLLMGRPVLKRFGIAATIISGLYIYACGALLFWPAAVSSSFPTLIISNIIVGSGFGVLDTAANLFVAICGPLKYSEIRLCLSKGAGDTAIIFARLLETRVFGQLPTPYMVSVQWTSLAIAFFNVILAVIFYYLPVPEVPDEEEELDELIHHNSHDIRLFGLPVIWLTLGLGVWSMFFYGGALGSIHIDLIRFTKAHGSRSVHTSDRPSPLDFVLIAQSVWTVGHFFAAYIQWVFLKPRQTLLILYLGCIVFSALCMRTSGLTAVITGLMLFFLEGGILPIIFGIALRRTGHHIKTAACLLETAFSSAAFFPFARYAAELAHGQSYSYCVIVAVFCAGTIFPLYLNFFSVVKRQVDPI
uniref:L-fucose-proton symporter n=1 Tax=Talaromyces marneffei PM1 TaxID=1077442 RepID=A0A093VFJ4_TALMA